MIGPGHEQAVRDLFAPHELGTEIDRGFDLWNVSIQPARIVVTLRASADGRETTVTLLHPDRAPSGAPTSRSFAAVVSGASDADARAARARLIAAVQRNDDGGFWDTATVTPVRGGTGGSSVSLSAFSWGSRVWVPLDGVTVIVLVWLLSLGLAWRLLLREPKWMGAALAGVVITGALVRVALSPPIFLGAWPWSRLYPHVRAVAQGEWIEALAEHAGHPFFLTDVTMWTNYAYAAAMPLVLFCHGSFLTKNTRVGLAAAFALAFLPQHIRFSRSEDGFVASLVLTSLAFALIHAFLRDRSRLVRWCALLTLPFVLYPGYLLRPLNILFIVVYAAAIVGLHETEAPRWRRFVALGVVLLVGAIAGFEFLASHSEPAGAALRDWSWLARSFVVLVTPSFNVLIDPTRTPPALIVLAVAGGVLLWRAGDKRTVVFLVGWLFLFLSTHSVVLTQTMQPRYHLHLVVPFLLLAASAVPLAAPRWRPWLWAAAASIALAPWIHIGFVRDIGYAEMHEYLFVRRMRDVVPEGCTIVEILPDEHLGERRFERIGALVGADRHARFRTLVVTPEGHAPPDGPSLDDVLADPPGCIYLYEGLGCTIAGRPERPYAEGCQALRRRLGARPVASATAPAAFYDTNNAPAGEPRLESIPFRLSVVRSER